MIRLNYLAPVSTSCTEYIRASSVNSCIYHMQGAGPEGSEPWKYIYTCRLIIGNVASSGVLQVLWFLKNYPWQVQGVWTLGAPCSCCGERKGFTG